MTRRKNSNVDQDKEERRRLLIYQIADQAGVPPANREEFRADVEDGLSVVHEYDGYKLRGLNDEAMLRAERAIRLAQKAFRALRAEQQDELNRVFAEVTDGALDEIDLSYIFAFLPFALTGITGSHTAGTFNRGTARRGPPAGSSRNFPLQYLVEGLWCDARRHGGCLTASCKSGKGSGSMFKALRSLAPLLPKNFVRAGMDQTITNWVASLRDRRARMSEELKAGDAQAWTAATKRSRKRQTRST